MVVDTSALFAIAFDEPERSSFARAVKMASHRSISAATLVECVAVFAGRRPEQDPSPVIDLLVQELGIEVIPFTAAHYRVAAAGLLAFGKGRHPARLNLGDSFAYALAKTSGEPLLFKGDDFSRTDIHSAL